MPKLKVELQQRQIDAINNWKRANRRGIFAMATGTGKTKEKEKAILQNRMMRIIREETMGGI